MEMEERYDLISRLVCNSNNLDVVREVVVLLGDDIINLSHDSFDNLSKAIPEKDFDSSWEANIKKAYAILYISKSFPKG